MASCESNLKNMLLALMGVSLVSSAALATVFQVTKEKRDQVLLLKKVKAIQQVVPEFDNNPLDEKEIIQKNAEEFVLYPAKKANQTIALAIETTSKQGFGGDIKLMVGFLKSGKIYDIAVIQQKETPGLGDKMDRKKSKFSLQFKDKDPSVFRLNVKKDRGDVDAITAATISSRAFCGAVKAAYAVFKEQSL